MTGGGKIRFLTGLRNSAGFLADFGTIDVPDTGGQFETIWMNKPVDLTYVNGLADSVVRLEFEGRGFEVDWFEFAPATQTSYVEGRTIKADFSTTTIQLEKYDHGGQGAAYFDDTPGIPDYQSQAFDIAGNDSSNSFRTDEDVDANEQQLQNKVFDGEWLEYTTNIHAGTYDLTLRKDWGGDDNSVKLFIASNNSALMSTPPNEPDAFTLLGEFSFGNADSDGRITLTDIDLSQWAGSDRVLRIEIVGNWMGLDYLEFESSSQTAPTVDIVDVSPDPRETSVGEVAINFDEDVSGVDIGDLTLTRDGDAVDISGLILTTVSPGRYTIDLSTVTGSNGDYELRLNGTGSGIQDLSGNALATDAFDQFMIELSDTTGPQVESVVINDGDSQRSMVSLLTVTFSEEVQGVDAGSFILTNTTTNIQVVPVVFTQVINGKTVATLSFSGAGITGGSLADGDYTLTTLASSVTDASGNQLDGNGDGTGGDNATDTFFRFFGDVNGDRRVNISDFFQFRGAFRGSYNPVFDFNNDGNINIADFFQFRSRFGKTL